LNGNVCECLIVSEQFEVKNDVDYRQKESVRMTENRDRDRDSDKWRKYVHGVANPRIEEG